MKWAFTQQETGQNGFWTNEIGFSMMNQELLSYVEMPVEQGNIYRVFVLCYKKPYKTYSEYNLNISILDLAQLVTYVFRMLEKIQILGSLVSIIFFGPC